MAPGRDRTRDPWICSQTHICSQTRYRLRYAARYLVIVMRQSWGGGGYSHTLIFSSYVGSGPASTVHPKKYQEFQAPQKKFEILATKIIPYSVP